MEIINVGTFPDLVGKKIIKDGFEWRIESYLNNESNANVFVIKKKGDDNDYVLKLEDIESGPLFCEFHFYLKMQNKIPEYINIIPMVEYGFKIAVHFIKQRNIVLYKKKHCLQDWKFLKLELFTNFSHVASFCLKVIQVLEFINSLGYVHGDIKPRNIVFDDIYNPFVIDFGIVQNYIRANYVRDNKYKNGSFQYMSLDAHKGIVSQRTDLFSFGFILFSILEKKQLPWYGVADIKVLVRMKKDFLKNRRSDFFTHPILKSYFSIVDSRNYDEKPNYNELYSLFSLLDKQ